MRFWNMREYGPFMDEVEFLVWINVMFCEVGEERGFGIKGNMDHLWKSKRFWFRCRKCLVGWGDKEGYILYAL
jgi:hypothetical protein